MPAPTSFRPSPRPTLVRDAGRGLVSRLSDEPGPEEAELIAALRRVLHGGLPAAGGRRFGR